MVSKYLFQLLCALVALILLGPPGLTAQTQVVLNPSKDNTMYQDSTGGLSNGAGQGFFAGRNATGTIRRGLLAFNITDSIPAGSNILSVTLTLNCSQTVSGAQEVSLHRASADWGEGTSIAAGNGGGGAPATPNDATWLHRFFNTLFWSSVGGDFLPTPRATQTVTGLGSYTWASTPEMVADVQQWLDSPSTNFGWVVVGNEAVSATAKRFDSRENINPLVRPRLTVTYQPPVGVGETPGVPTVFALEQNYPNPFNPATTIAYALPRREHVSLQVFNLLGEKIATLVNEVQELGTKSVVFSATNLVSGIYFYRLQAGSFTQTRSLVVLK
jgi:hypothetical protein